MDLFRKKDLNQLAMQSTSLKRSLTTSSLIFLGIGAIIGTGIFVLTGVGALTAGPALSLSFLIAAFACGFAALCYAEFASMAPISGSAYTYAYISFGELIAFIMGWDLLLEYGLAASSVAAGWSGYFQSILANVGIHIPHVLSAAYGTQPGAPTYFDLPAFAIVLIITTFISMGINKTKKLNNIMVIIKLSVIILFILGTIWYINVANWKPFAPYGWYKFIDKQAYGIIPAAAIVFYAFIGFDAISSSAEETINPEKSLPKGILFSLLIASILYIIMTLIMTGVVPYTEYANYLKAPIMAVVEATHQTWLGLIVSIGAIVGITTVILVMLYGQSRIIYAMSRDGLLPKFLSSVHKKFATPFIGTWTLSTITALLAGFVNIRFLAELVNIGTLFAFMLVSAGIIWMRYAQPNLKRGFKTPLVPLLPIISVAFCLVLISGLNMKTWIYFFAWISIGFIVFFSYSRRHSNLNIK